MAKCVQCGQSGMMLKVNGNGLCISCVSSQLDTMQKENARISQELKDAREENTQTAHALDELQARITPDFINAEAIIDTINKRSIDLQALEDHIASKEAEEKELSKQIKERKKQLLVVSDSLEFESFALYVPRYDFASSEEYKQRLDAIRDEQKKLIKEKTAIIASDNWEVNGSKAEGRKMAADLSKLLLRSFNHECDAAVASVRFSNFDRCKDRIINAFDTINKLGSIGKTSISHQYRQSKINELSLAYEYQCKKEEERERIRELKARQKEEALLQKEIQEARKEAEKERKHYLIALEKLEKQLIAAQTEEDRTAVIEKKNEVVGYLDDINKKLEDIDYRQSNQRAGYVYVISNIGSFGPDVYKIGMTRRLEPMERIYELGDASVPFQFDVHAMIFSEDAPQLEAALHHAFDNRRVNMVNNRREYFHVTLDEIKRVVYENHDKTVEFTDEPYAEQYRQSEKMRQ